ncbi:MULTISPECIES: DUF3761 domain-containing protein [Mycobacterium avium complex (MAC)]|uniref:DUF3761 domain-containing protein n=2 Tax=Mycobacterium TaxID=1763 RepID=A0AAI8SPL8_MYCAV|nr:hypothetical protein BS641_18105 [Mycobacterium avium subsp. hominissuis]MCA2237454.1 DUF3761 domain-containing protein [Mycobacterium avium]MBZ4511002.1 DUF3761 domain-containing protein [Mycobacterium avium subsp. hominissuis]MBZ4573577.1 DUF3761 domain-containing protein [Mycobacterium avium subsp. hominissuis]MCA2259654.1 DUF3761 domain-containing protein [Mycobacterium avium]
MSRATKIIVAPATMTAALSILAPLSPMDPRPSCGGYINVDGNCVPSPDHTRSSLPDNDGTYSHSQHKQGSGSWHGGTGRSK